MKAVILTYGSRGDVEPFFALANGLIRAGHDALVVGPGTFSTLASERGIAFIPLPGDPEAVAADLVQVAGHSPWKMVHVVSKLILPIGAEVYHIAREVCRGADVVVNSFLFTTGGPEIVDQLGIPSFSAQLFPIFTATGDFPGVVTPDLPLGRKYRHLTHAILEQVFWQGSRLLYRRVRRENPDFPPLSGWPLAKERQPPVPVLYAYSRHVLPRPADWPDHAHVTGYWFRDETEPHGIPEALKSFLMNGPPPVYIGFGSVIAGDPARFARIAVKALNITGQRGVLATGWGGLQAEELPEHVFAISDVPHSWLFPKMVAAVHHGGAGTTGASLRAGIPTLIVPFTSDQPFWGRRVHHLGAGPAPISPRRLNAQNLASAIREMVGDEAMRSRAARLGEAIRMEDGVGHAVSLIEAAR